MMNIQCLFFFAIRSILAAEISSTDWWKHSVLYEIWPRSFKDSNNDGIGDLRGIIETLDYISESGINIIWLASIFKSPQLDAGYDVSNYLDIDSDYGTLDDLKELLEKAHLRGIKVIVDFIPNHTSNQHQWFIGSVKGIEEYRDYYIWANAVIDKSGKRQHPNNWISLSGNSAWTWNEERQQYYFHQFTAAQPDLNYYNPKVVEAMNNVITFWLDHDVDGFRIDAAPHIFEVQDLRDEPESGLPGHSNTDYKFLDHIYTRDQPETFQLVYSWRKLIDNYTKEHGTNQKVLMTEAYSDVNHTMLYFGTPDGSQLGAHVTFNFNLIEDINENSTAQDIVNSINKWLDSIPEIYTSNWVIGNHDIQRAATRFGPGNVDGFNMLKSLLPGIAVTYNGEEIGQENGYVSYEDGQDPLARDPAIFFQVSRDFERTPYQWDNTTNAGFNNGAKPWLPVDEKYLVTNLKQQQETDGSSHYKIYQALSEIRSNSVLVNGDVTIKVIDDHALLLKRSYNGSSIALVLNKGNQGVCVNVEEDIANENQVEIKSVNSTKEIGSAIEPVNLNLYPFEAVIVSF